MTEQRLGLAPARIAGHLRAAVALAVRAAPGRTAVLALGTLLSAALPVAAALLTRAVVDGLARGATGPGWTGAVGALAGVGVLIGLGPAVLAYVRADVERAVALLAKDRLFRAVDTVVGVARFEDPDYLDRLMLADESGGRGPGQVIDSAFGVFAAALTVGGLVASLWTVSPVVAAAVLLSGLPVLAAELILGRQRAWTEWDISPAKRRELFYRDMLATEQAAKEVRLFRLGGFLRERMLRERRSAQAAEHATDRRAMLVQSGLATAAAIVAGAALLVVTAQSRAGAHSVGDIAMFLAAVLGVQTALAGAAAQAAKAIQALLLFDSYRAVLADPPDLPVPAVTRPAPPLRTGIELRDVWFRYGPNHPWVLRGLDLTIPAGRATALVGRNGCGKSTLVKLLCRFYDPTRGAILWDGIDLRELDPAELRARISAVFQDYVNYELSAAENIGVGDLPALDDRPRIHAAAGRAGMHELLAALPHGYDTMLGRRFNAPDAQATGMDTGVNPSGGQRQRIAIARAFLRDARDLVILDEPSAGLDAAAEHEVHARLRAERAGLTSVLISHRLNAIREADDIVVLADGAVHERGDHETLLAVGGEYATLFALQASGYQPAGA
ncbi:ABC transporter ATP-binding protein [Dactylosporangium vinaceum]|uniref:ABC transporter ATP-binding protein n=1 Tax=Dactylosporangium vinaceum TaxID=53362 RepID=A0ABV5MDG1_9ACTN|nr:ABC transporter ATP-binding protein [Dactylosporangium vinaceum]UAC01162.1 ABC transporter ATP-binding protein [Dactylosporangium vinaceum]